MKRLLYISIIFMAAACKREPLTTYHVKDNIYFSNEVGTGNYVDSLDFSFAYSDATVKETTVNIPLGVTGSPAATDRHYKLVVDPASTALAGTHFEFPDMVFRAGKVRDTLHLLLKRTPDLASGTKKLILRLQPNDDFNTELLYRVINNGTLDTVSMVAFSLTTTDILTAGPYWVDTYARYFGPFSLKKVNLMHDVLGMPLNIWSIAAPTTNQRITVIYYASVMGHYLADEKNKGNLILDEDGTAMTMGPAYQ